jgi:acetylornithine deacetylase/succinyl-diaminopimelate desuccinylase-like protein
VGSGLNGDGLPAVMTNPAITPDAAAIDIDLKFLPGQRSEEVRSAVEEFVHHWTMQDSWLRRHPPEVRWELGGLYFPPFDTDPADRLVRSVQEARRAIGRDADLGGFVAVADAAFYATAGTSVVMHGHHGSGAHGADEWVDVESIVDAAKTYALTALEYCGVRGWA